MSKKIKIFIVCGLASFGLQIGSLMMDAEFDLIPQVQAEKDAYDEFFGNLQDKIKEDTKQEINLGTAGDSYIKEGDDGLTIINRILKKVVSFWKYIIGSIAVLMIVIAGFRMATSTEEETINSQKQIVLWAVLGLVFVLVVDTFVLQLFYGGQTGEDSFVFSSAQNIIRAVGVGKNEIAGFIDWLLPFISSLAVMMIVLSGVRTIMAFGSEDLINKEKMLFYWVTFGLVVIALSKILVNALYTPPTEGEVKQQYLAYLQSAEIGETDSQWFQQQYPGLVAKAPGEITITDLDINRIPIDFFQVRTGNSNGAIAEIAGMISWILIFVGLGAVVMLIYGGFMMVANWGFEDGVEKAKKIIFGAVVGLVIIFTAYALVATLISAQGGYG